jgi:hypothetical protein
MVVVTSLRAEGSAPNKPITIVMLRKMHGVFFSLSVREVNNAFCFFINFNGLLTDLFNAEGL